MGVNKHQQKLVYDLYEYSKQKIKMIKDRNMHAYGAESHSQ